MDGNSEANVQRLLPDAYNFLKDELNGFMFKGFSVVGEATTPQLTAMLTGKTLQENCKIHEGRKGYENSGTLDNWPFIFKTLAEHGYATMFSEDGPAIGESAWFECYDTPRTGESISRYECPISDYDTPRISESIFRYEYSVSVYDAPRVGESISSFEFSVSGYNTPTTGESISRFEYSIFVYDSPSIGESISRYEYSVSGYYTPRIGESISRCEYSVSVYDAPRIGESIFLSTDPVLYMVLINWFLGIDPVNIYDAPYIDESVPRYRSDGVFIFATGDGELIFRYDITVSLYHAPGIGKFIPRLLLYLRCAWYRRVYH